VYTPNFLDIDRHVIIFAVLSFFEEEDFNAACLYTNVFKNWFLAASAGLQIFGLHSRLAIQQWSLAPDTKICAASLPNSQVLNPSVYISVNLFNAGKTMRFFYLLGILTFMSIYAHAHLTLRHSIEEVCFDHPLYPVVQPREEGYLKVSGTHSLFYAVYGNPQGIPVVVLHGGPGAGCSDAFTRHFDLKKWNVIMFDQRGAMRSKPFGCMEENTPQHSMEDIEALRRHLRVDKWIVFGGSWGTTLAVLYGQKYPESCLGFILRGIFLGREQDYLHLFYGMGKVFPEAYEPVVNYIPQEERHDLLGAYYRRIMDPNPEISLEAARVFMRFDMICSTQLPNPEAVEGFLQNDKYILGIVKTFLHYAMNHFFLEPNQILTHMHKIKHLPAIIVHGRWDAICLPSMAYDLYQRWDNSMAWIVTQGGHSSYDPAIAAALAKATDFFAENKRL
jgi:proline iminopeptidase